MLQRYTAADRGLVEIPLLTPHLRFHVLEDDKSTVILRSETFATAVHGDCLPPLMPLLDGSRTRGEIVARLGEAHSAIDIQTALASLASRGFLVSADFGMSREAAAFWTAQGASPRWAEQRFASMPLSVSGDSGELSALLAEMGARRGTELSVVVCADYLDAPHAETNRRQLARGAPWVLVRPQGIQPLFGPVFRPRGGACWECLAYRLRANREVESFLFGAEGGAPGLPAVGAPAWTQAARGLAAVEIAKWIVFGESAPMHEHAVSITPAAAGIERHAVARRPQCRACGNPSLFRPDRAAAPVTLRPSPSPVRNSGGSRSVPPEETLARYRRLVSPVSGVVASLERITDPANPWLHVYKAQSNINPNSDTLEELSGNIRGRSSGKGSSAAQSEASALCEAVERYSLAFRGEEIQRLGRFCDFLDAGADEAIHPNDVELFSERQFARAERPDATPGHVSAASAVPPRFDPEAEISWTPVWSLTRGSHRWLPTELLYRAMPRQPKGSKRPRRDANSNGCSAGNTLEEAVLQGFLELVERDSVAIWWFNRLRRPAVDLDSFGDEYLAGARERYLEWGREMWVLDLTGDLGIPAFAAVSRRIDHAEERILHGFGAHLDPRVAALRAVCEMNQVLPAFHDGAAMSVEIGESWVGRWLREAKIADYVHEAPDPESGLRDYADVAVPECGDARDAVEHCRNLVEAQGLEFLVLDLTRPDVGMPVARVIVPGLRHFWPRFAPGRLYDVPVKMGWLESPTAEADLNPFLVAG